MNIEYHKWYSPQLDRDMELKFYGHSGKPFILFPTQGGRFFQAEDEGILDAVSAFISDGTICIIAVDSMDNESWADRESHPQQRGLHHVKYENYILQEVIPFIQNHFNDRELKLGCTGFSMGGYHAANFFFKHPDIFDVVIAISGFYNLKLLVGDYFDDLVYFNSPNLYLKNLDDQEVLNLLRNSKIVICSGQGAWEEEMLEETLTLKSILEQKRIPAWIDIWGKDVNHDWPWWRKMLPYFLEKIDV
jgi:esterase/lipase superfamily enzyme